MYNSIDDSFYLFSLFILNYIERSNSMNKKQILFLSIFSFAFSLFIFALFFPTLPIYGYVHQVPSGDYSITIVPNTLFHVLKDNYYSQGLKASYIISFILQIINVLASILFLVLALKEKTQKYPSWVCLVPGLLLSILLIITFYHFTYPFIITCLYFIFLGVFLFFLLSSRKKEKQAS